MNRGSIYFGLKYFLLENVLGKNIFQYLARSKN
jgi:hypothetical protein